MAVTIAAHTGSEANFHDRFGIGMPWQLEYNIDFGEAIDGRLVHINLWMWGKEGTIETPQPLPPHPLGQGYNHIHNGVDSYQTMTISGSPPGSLTWENKTVEIRYPTANTARIRIRYIHTHDLNRWIAGSGISNEKRLLYATPDAPMLTYEEESFYYPQPAVNRHLGIRAQLWELLESGNWKYNIGKDEAILRYWAWFWNPAQDQALEWPYSPVRNYYFQLYRDNIPVLTFSDTADTDVEFGIERHPTNTFATTYHVGLMRVFPTPDNNDNYWDAIPYPLGRVSTTNTFSAAASWHHKDIGGNDIVGNCSTFAVDTGDLLKCNFVIPKEVIEKNTVYRLVVIIQNTFVGGDP